MGGRPGGIWRRRYTKKGHSILVACRNNDVTRFRNIVEESTAYNWNLGEKISTPLKHAIQNQSFDMTSILLKEKKCSVTKYAFQLAYRTLSLVMINLVSQAAKKNEITIWIQELISECRRIQTTFPDKVTGDRGEFILKCAVLLRDHEQFLSYCETGEWEKAERIIQKYPRFNLNYKTPLAIACMNNHADFAQNLLQWNYVSGENRALYHACSNSNLKCVRFLLGLPRTNAGYARGKAFRCAWDLGYGQNKSKVLELLTKRPELKIESDYLEEIFITKGYLELHRSIIFSPCQKEYMLHNACNSIFEADLFKKIVNLPGIDVNQEKTPGVKYVGIPSALQHKSAVTALYCCCSAKRHDLVQILLEIPTIDVNAGCPVPLEESLRLNDYKTALLLLQNGADPTKVDPKYFPKIDKLRGTTKKAVAQKTKQ